MKLPGSSILTLNCGSSSIRFALFARGASLERKLTGKLERIGLRGQRLTFRNSSSQPGAGNLGVPDAVPAPSFLLDWLEAQTNFDDLEAVGHRLVHGMHHTQPEPITPELLSALRQIAPQDPEHLPLELELIDALSARRPQLLQVACFDTAFHSGMPRVARQLPIPRRYEALGLQRYGFHGLSYAYVLEELTRVAGPTVTSGRVVLAHLGGGASMAAVKGGASIDTSMGFTPASGLPMGTRSGDVDPGLGPFLARSEHLSAAELHAMLNHESGLLGISEISSDMRELLAREPEDVRAAEAVALFCYQAKKWIGAFVAALSGLDALVFTGGIGENAALIRQRICDGLGFLGLELSPPRNASNAALISSDASRVEVRVIPTDEELMVARSVQRLLEARST
jgi:acetate kinase